MAIKVQIPAGAESVTVRGLYQWDYGQVLEIESVEIGSEILEAHFACHNMPEAVVRVCSFTNGVGTVTIPDQCLEQTGAVTVWLCEVDSTQAHTIKTISLPIAARTRPSRTRDVPTDFVDAYGQLIEEVNEAVDAIENGNVTAAKATYANTAGHARTAGSAQSATHATVADNASNAQIAQVANAATSVTTILHATVNITNGEGVAPSLSANGIYIVVLYQDGVCSCGVFAYADAISNAHIGNYNMNIYNKTITLSNTLSDNQPNGTLKFYKLGGLS